MKISKNKLKKIRVFSGSRPTGPLHLGNYLSGVKGYLALQEKKGFDCLYGIMDLHGITSPYEPENYQNQVNNLVLDYLACGLNPKKCHLIIQSQIPEHLELSYLLGTIYPVSRLEQLPTYKDKKQEQPNYINLGLLYYPVLMAADILIYKSVLVPVGKDQLPHIETTREIARTFNRYFGYTFPEPEAYLMKIPLIPSLVGKGKMSKSVEGTYINLIDDLETIKKKLAKVPTDNGKGTKVPQEGGVATLLTFVELFIGFARKKVLEKQYLNEGIKYQSLKEELAKAIYRELKPIQEKRGYYEKNPKLVKKILAEGKNYAQNIACQTLKEVKIKMGLIK